MGPAAPAGPTGSAPVSCAGQSSPTTATTVPLGTLSVTSWGQHQLSVRLVDQPSRLGHRAPSDGPPVAPD